MQNYMQHALNLARRGLGNVAPNPAVGCIIVKDNKIIGRGWTQPGGRPHAEAMALQQAGDAASGADLYVTLEPCFVPGRGAPCTQAIMDADISRIFIAMRDPHPRVNGQGIAALHAAGIEVHEGLCADAARELNKGFLSVVERNRPMVTLKLAVSADWKMTTGDADNPWITGEAARMHGHLLRANHDAIMVGIGTVLADNPVLDCRLPGLEKFSPVRVVLDKQNQLPENSKLKSTADQIPLWQITETDPHKILADLAVRGITRLLIEGGAKTAQKFLNEELVDEIVIYQSQDSYPNGLLAPELAKDFVQKDQKPLGDDQYHHYVKA